MALKNKTVNKPKETDGEYSGLIKRVELELVYAHGNTTGVCLEETNYEFNTVGTKLREATRDRLLLTTLMIVIIDIVTITFLIKIENIPNGRMNFVMGLIMFSLMTLVFNYIKGGREIAKMEESQSHHRFILERFRKAVRSLCINDSQFENFAHFSKDVVANNLMEMAIEKLRAEGYMELVYHKNNLDSIFDRQKAKVKFLIAERTLRRAFRCSERDFGLKIKKEGVIKLATDRMNENPTEPLRGFPATAEPVRA
jgi:hypothetical protein